MIMVIGTVTEITYQCHDYSVVFSVVFSVVSGCDNPEGSIVVGTGVIDHSGRDYLSL